MRPIFPCDNCFIWYLGWWWLLTNCWSISHKAILSGWFNISFWVAIINLTYVHTLGSERSNYSWLICDKVCLIVILDLNTWQMVWVRLINYYVLVQFINVSDYIFWVATIIHVHFHYLWAGPCLKLLGQYFMLCVFYNLG